MLVFFNKKVLPQSQYNQIATREAPTVFSTSLLMVADRVHPQKQPVLILSVFLVAYEESPFVILKTFWVRNFDDYPGFQPKTTPVAYAKIYNTV